MAKCKLTKSSADLIEEIVNLKFLLKESERLRDIDIGAKTDYWEALRQIADSAAMDPEAALVARAALREDDAGKEEGITSPRRGR